MKNINKMIITASIAAVILCVTSSYAWLMYFEDESGGSNMGIVKVAVSEIAEVTEEGIATFEIANDSTIDTYIRLGWTPIYKDKTTDRELTRDVSQIDIIETALTGLSRDDPMLAGMMLRAGEITSYGYGKKVITMEDENGQYFVVPAGTNIICRISLNVSNNPGSESSLHLIMVPEALQATKKAVEEAVPNGWIVSKAGSQASSIIVKGGGGNGQN